MKYGIHGFLDIRKALNGVATTSPTSPQAVRRKNRFTLSRGGATSATTRKIMELATASPPPTKVAIEDN
jgi:hypothetical protein